ncbi:mobile element protein [Gracilibacillus boraciitolerans JCM 21714]|uniref:Mobile element protein n=1 Tax=Gracilibacillus boraciitolerans JCM 21714 TaxID=1298598 RepID=W4VNT8_9BACI|nr:helix-turn-helix domain-containing protein [Gracilibacillus boraciitolerans]GAE95040.1 mobile element protein [Gracilibacillus boraciitolerans JCM 21714]
MIDLKKKQEVLLMHIREGRSQREIAQSTSVDRKTVRKYIKEYETKRCELEKLNSNMDSGELIQSIVEAPRYQVGKRVKRKLTKEMEQRIQEQIVENKEKVKKGLRKQLKKPIDIHEMLEMEGFDISYSTVLRVVRKLENKPKEAYIKAAYLPGDICEFDWGGSKSND